MDITENEKLAELTELADNLEVTPNAEEVSPEMLQRALADMGLGLAGHHPKSRLRLTKKRISKEKRKHLRNIQKASRIVNREVSVKR